MFSKTFSIPKVGRLEHLKNNWKYGNYCQKYDMCGEIKIGTGVVKAHDIFESLPQFMKNADVVFSDPPCSRGNLTSFYTKAEKKNTHDYTEFYERFFEVLQEINPKLVFIEVFKSNFDIFSRRLENLYQNVSTFESMYYNQPKNKCWILVASDEEVPDYPFNGIDEQKVIELICKNVDFNCIADPCMGKGLVGFYANRYGKKFVGTELNPKRLAVLLERINTGKLIMR